jgi:hypothetical protein
VSRFTEYAEQILAAAETAAARGKTCSEMTILIGEDGGIHMLADSDWPLDSLAFYHGARAAYRVSQRSGEVRVEGREAGRRCVLSGRTINSPLPTIPAFLCDNITHEQTRRPVAGIASGWL